MQLTEKKIKSHQIYKGKIINVRKDLVSLPDGNQSTREIVEHPGAVGIIALDNDDHILLVRQYRHPVERVILEIPAGKLDPGEEPLRCAKRELAEEVKAKAHKWLHLLTFFTTPGFSNEIMHLFLATDLTTYEEYSDPDEFLELYKLPAKDIIPAIKKGQIQDAKSIVGLLFFVSCLKA